MVAQEGECNPEDSFKLCGASPRHLSRVGQGSCVRDSSAIGPTRWNEATGRRMEAIQSSQLSTRLMQHMAANVNRRSSSIFLPKQICQSGRRQWTEAVNPQGRVFDPPQES